MLGSVWEELWELWCRILWPMWCSVTYDHHNRPMWVHPLGMFKVVNAVIGDKICEIVLENIEKTNYFFVFYIHYHLINMQIIQVQSFNSIFNATIVNPVKPVNISFLLTCWRYKSAIVPNMVVQWCLRNLCDYPWRSKWFNEPSERITFPYYFWILAGHKTYH